ncbi:type I polyketide synthase [Polyangium sp. 15x6]|uniref:type I polyketide synthase n=1 Tax=Polyangium sp. 15x6 TaxID=3042687 RepID=UPI00249CE310|nr:type I polyketide synthase [Polyangium sp. 15x6]MDI3287045.1 SDR family NAD(P)-dependent oxidoreductase [Polyangium sp. 15x6]
MHAGPVRKTNLSALKLAYLAQKLHAEGETAELLGAEPIAIIGMACRFPGGASSLEAFWELLRTGRDAISEIPPTRWDADALFDPDPAAVGKVATRWGGFVEPVDAFDGTFFGISPREAARMDPQQRLLLEVTWEALEHAGQAHEGLRGSATGIFTGICTWDYFILQSSERSAIDAYTSTGSALTMAANRISYLLDLRGPSMAIDTACSSSLVALHLACQSLRRREIGMALVGGANAILTPEVSMSLSKWGVMAPDGRCKPFDARANGFVRGEGCGVVVLKRLSDALAEGDPILAVVRGSAVNQDGRSAGLTAPNPQAQRAVIQRALEDAGVSPARIGLVEAHGTGTELGDPIELEGLASTFGSAHRGRQTCALGAVKANVGHLEAASGICGIIKVVLAMQHEAIPPLVHFKALNPKISLEGTPFYIPTEVVPWPMGDEPRCAGVSAFGMGGTNAHVVLEEAPRLPAHRASDTPSVGPRLLPLSARSPEALEALARAFRGLLLREPQGLGPEVHDLCYTAAVRRSHHEHRLAVTGSTREELAARIDTFLQGKSGPGMVSGQKHVAGFRKVAFVFAPHGSQWAGMGRDLLAQVPAFRDALQRCDEAIRAEAGWSVIALLTGKDTSWMDRIELLHPTLFALQVALAAVWRSWGIEPDAVIGHSVGEVAAAHVAGALDLEDAVAVVCRRSAILRRAVGDGAMAIVELPMEAALEAVAGYEPRISIGASNSPRFTVLSGDRATLDEVLRTLTQQGIFCGAGVADVASHTPRMAPFRQELGAALASLSPRPAAVTIYSACDGSLVEGRELGAEYWLRHLTQPVLFWPALAQIFAAEHEVFVEIGPHPLLAPFIEEALAHTGKSGAVHPSLRRDEPGQAVLLESFGALHVAGHPVSWKRLYPTGRNVPLPAHPWQRTSSWFDGARPGERRARPRLAAADASAGDHPLLGRHVTSPLQGGAHLWQRELGVAEMPWLSAHRVRGLIVVPGTAMLEMALEAATDVLGPGPCALEEVSFERALLLPEEGSRVVQLVVLPARPGAATFELHSLPLSTEGPGTTWTLHARGTVVRDTAEGTTARTALDEIASRCHDTVPGAEHYRVMAERGVDFGPAFQALEHVLRRDGEALGRIRLPVQAGRAPYRLHPVILDACFQSLAQALPRGDERARERRTFLPVGVGRLRVHASPRAEALWAHVVLRDASAAGAALQADVRLLDETGTLLAEAEGFRAQQLDPTEDAPSADMNHATHEVAWRPWPLASAPRPSRAEPATWLLLADASGLGRRLAARLEAGGDACIVVPSDLDEDTRRRRVEEALADAARPIHRIVHLWGLDAEPPERTTLGSLGAARKLGCEAILDLVQRLVRIDRPSPPRLWIVTRGAQPAGAARHAIAVAQAPLCGLGLTIAHEHPELRCAQIDLDPASSPAELDELARTLVEDPGEDRIALRGSQRLVARLLPRALRSLPSPARLRPDASYLVVGGLGGLGLSVGRWLVEGGARNLVLVGRRAPSAAARESIEAMSRAGARVHVAQVDISDPGQLTALVADVARTMPPLRGVIHSAVVLDDGVLVGQTPERFARVMAAKVEGSWNLHQATLGAPLDLFVLFSSAASILGSPGQGSYAAANAFQDALAHDRRARGLCATSINWGPWSEVGLAAAQENRGARLEASGFRSLSPAEGLALLGRILDEAPAQIGAFPFDLEGWCTYFPQVAASPLLAELVQEHRGVGANPRTGQLRAALAEAPAEERASLLEAQLAAIVAQVMRLPESHAIPWDQPLGTLGFDSLMAVELRNRLESSLALRLPAGLVWSYPTLVAMAKHLLERIALSPAPAAPAAPPPDAAASTQDEDLARILEQAAELPDHALRALLAGP